MKGFVLTMNEHARTFLYLTLILLSAIIFRVWRMSVDLEGEWDAGTNRCLALSGGAYFLACGKKDLTNATQLDLEAVPGIGPALAKAILDYRDKHGTLSFDELVKVRGIGEKRLKVLMDYFHIGDGN